MSDKLDELLNVLLGKATRYQSSPMVYGHQMDRFIDLLSQSVEAKKEKDKGQERLLAAAKLMRDQLIALKLPVPDEEMFGKDGL